MDEFDNLREILKITYRYLWIFRMKQIFKIYFLLSSIYEAKLLRSISTSFTKPESVKNKRFDYLSRIRWLKSICLMLYMDNQSQLQPFLLLFDESRKLFHEIKVTYNARKRLGIAITCRWPHWMWHIFCHKSNGNMVSEWRYRKFVFCNQW